jgi:hypothetical protein
MPKGARVYIFIFIFIFTALYFTWYYNNNNKIKVCYLFIYLLKFILSKKVLGLFYLPDKKKGGEHLGAHGLDTQLKICHIIIWSPLSSS